MWAARGGRARQLIMTNQNIRWIRSGQSQHRSHTSSDWHAHLMRPNWLAHSLQGNASSVFICRHTMFCWWSDRFVWMTSQWKTKIAASRILATDLKAKPQARTVIPSVTFFKKSIYSIYRCTFMVSSKNKKISRIFDLNMGHNIVRELDRSLNGYLIRKE